MESRCKGTLENRCQRIVIRMYYDVCFAKKQLIKFLKSMDDSIDDRFAYLFSVGVQRTRAVCYAYKYLSYICNVVTVPFSWMNDFPVIGDPCFAHMILGSPVGKHCESLQRNVWRGVVSPLKAVSLDRECRILPWFYEKRRWLMFGCWNFKFLCD